MIDDPCPGLDHVIIVTREWSSRLAGGIHRQGMSNVSHVNHHAKGRSSNPGKWLIQPIVCHVNSMPVASSGDSTIKQPIERPHPSERVRKHGGVQLCPLPLGGISPKALSRLLYRLL